MSKLRRFLSSARLYAAALLLGLAVWLTPERGGHKKRLLEQLILCAKDLACIYVKDWKTSDFP